MRPHHVHPRCAGGCGTSVNAPNGTEEGRNRRLVFNDLLKKRWLKCHLKRWLLFKKRWLQSTCLKRWHLFDRSTSISLSSTEANDGWQDESMWLDMFIPMSLFQWVPTNHFKYHAPRMREPFHVMGVLGAFKGHLRCSRSAMRRCAT